MDRLHLINVFVTVVDAEGLAKAARQLNVSPSVVTRAINELEADLGVQLLTRTTRFVRVTEAGARYAEDCRRILARLAEANEAVRGLHATPRGELVVTAPVMFGTRHVTPIVCEFLAQHAEVSVACWFVDRVVHLIEEGAEVAVRIGELPDSSLVAARVGAVRRVLCASPDYLARCGTPERPADLADHTIISATGITPSPEWGLVDGGTTTSVKLRPRLTTTSNEAAVVAAVQGFGIARLLSYQVAEEVRDGRLVVLIADPESAPIPVHVVHRGERHTSPRSRRFVDLAIERLRANPAIRG